MRWVAWALGVIFTLMVTAAIGKPAEHVTEERREYYHKTSKVVDSPIVYISNGQTHGSYTAGSDALSSSWAQSHMDEIKKMADRLRWEYFNKARKTGARKGGSRMRNGYSTISMADFPSFAGRSKEELDMLARQMTEQMINDMKSGKLLYSQVVRPNWFESQAAQQLQTLSQTQSENQQSQDVYGTQGFHNMPHSIGGGYHRTEEKKHVEYTSTHGGYQPVPTYASEVEDLNRREEHSSVAYPTTVTIIGGNRYVTKKNCTTTSSTLGSPMPSLPTYITRTTSYDKNIQNILDHGRDVPIVIDQSSYNKEESTVNKQQEQQSVPVYQGSYFTDKNYESQYEGQDIPDHPLVQGHTSETRDSSEYNRQYQPVTTFGGSSQTIQTSSTTVHKQQNQQIPIVIPTQQTSSTSSETYSQTDTQRPVPVVYPSSSTQRETSSFESSREHQSVPVPIPSTQRHSIYKHLQKETEIIPDYKPVVTFDSETINQELNKYYQQRPTTITRTEDTQQVQQDNRQVQPTAFIPEITITIHDQEDRDKSSDRRVEHVHPTVTSSQQTITSGQQSNVLYRPSYPAYGSQYLQNDTEFYEKYRSTYPQPIVTSSTYEKQEEDHTTKQQHQQIPVFGQTSQNTEEMSTSEVYRSKDRPVPVVVGGSTTYQESHEEHQRVPVFGQTSQNTEEVSTSEVYRSRDRPVPVVVGGSTTYQESNEERYTNQRRQQVPQTTVVQHTREEFFTGENQQSIPTASTYQESLEEHQEQHTNKQVVPQIHKTTEVTTEQNQTSTQQSQRPIYINSGSSYQIESEDKSQESTRYRPYPTGHQTSQISTETEDSYWSRRQNRPQTGVQTTQTQSEAEFVEDSRIRYPQTEVITSQNTQELETESEDIRQRPGHIGYTISSHINETSSSSASGSSGNIQRPVVITQSEETTLEGGGHSGSQVVIQSGYSEKNIERNATSTEVQDDRIHFPVESEEVHGQTVYDKSQGQGSYGGGMQYEHSEYGSQVNRSTSSGGGTIGYVTHQLTIEQREEEWRRQQEERRRQQLLSTGIFEASSLNLSSNNEVGGLKQIDVAKLGIHDGDENRLRNGTEHLDKAHYGSSADVSSTYASGAPPGTIISKDRGDQPPQHYEEDYDMNEAEPGIGHYPSEPEVANLVVPSTTSTYPPAFTAPLAPLAPLVIEKDVVDGNHQASVEVWPTTAGDTEVQRSYRRKMTTITHTIPVLLGPNGEIIQESGSSSVIAGSQLDSSALDGNTQNVAGGTYQSSSGGSYHSSTGGSYQSQGSATGSSGQIIQESESTSIIDRDQQQGGSTLGGSYQTSSDKTYQSQISGQSSQNTGGLSNAIANSIEKMIRGAGSTPVSSSQQYGSNWAETYQVTSGESYQPQVNREANLTSASSNIQQYGDSEEVSVTSGGSKDHQRHEYDQTYHSHSQSQQAAESPGGSGSSIYGSETRYTARPGAGYSGNIIGSYATGSSSSSSRYQDGGSYSQASAYSHQQNEDDNLDGYEQQSNAELVDVAGSQQTEDLTQQFVDDGQETENFHQGYEGYGQHEQSLTHGDYDQSLTHGGYEQALTHGSYDQALTSGLYDQSHSHGDYEQSSAHEGFEQSTNPRDFEQSIRHGAFGQVSAELDHSGQVVEQSSSSKYKDHSSYSTSYSSSSSGSSNTGTAGEITGSGNTSSDATSAQIPAEVNEEESTAEDQEKPGFWRRIGKKAKDLFG